MQVAFDKVNSFETVKSAVIETIAQAVAEEVATDLLNKRFDQAMSKVVAMKALEQAKEMQTLFDMLAQVCDRDCAAVLLAQKAFEGLKVDGNTSHHDLYKSEDAREAIRSLLEGYFSVSA